MIVLSALSIATVALVIYCFMTISKKKLLPDDFTDNIKSLLSEGKYEQARVMCEGKNDLTSKMIVSGFETKSGKTVDMAENMEDTVRSNIDKLWQRLSYLSDIASIAPMLGLLGTVLGMIQAFNVIAFQTGAVKPVLLASGISKAMVTTASGLILAIPAMIFYSYFRGVIQSIISHVEHVSSEFLNLLAKRLED